MPFNMLNTRYLLCGLLLLTACSNSPEEFRLSAAQLAWQPYHVGQVLRFGHTQDNKVRTYQITAVNDQMVKAYQMAIIGFPGKARDRLYQEITVQAQRTDTTTRVQDILDLRLSDDHMNSAAEFGAKVEWETFYYGKLPIDEVNNGIPIDTATYAFPGTELLAGTTLGSVTYAQVVHLTNRFGYGVPAPGIRRTSELYCTREQGIVAYREDGTGLWYRLP